MKKYQVSLSVTIPAVASTIAILLWAFGATREFWFDERFVQLMSAESGLSLVRHLRLETNPPVFFFLAHLWQSFLGSSELVLRVLTLVPTIGTFFILFPLARRIGGNRVAIIATLLMSVSGLSASQSAEFRVYPWIMFCTVLSLLLTVRIADLYQRRDLLLFLATVLVGFFSHYLFGLVVLTCLCWLWINCRPKRQELLLGFIVIVAISFPWLWYAVIPKFFGGQGKFLIDRLATDRFMGILQPVHQIYTIDFLTNPLWKIIQGIIGLICVIGISVSIVSWKKLRIKPLALILSVFFVGWLMTLAAGLTLIKYSTIYFPATVVLCSYGLHLLIKKNRTLITIIVCLFLVVGITSFFSVRRPLVLYRPVASTILANEQLGDALLIFPFNDVIALRPYYRGELNPVGYFPSKTPGDVTLDDITLNNYRVADSDLDVEPLDRYVGASSRVWMLFNLSPYTLPGQKITDWFREHGFSQTVYTDLFHQVPPLLIRYDRVTI